MFMKSDIEDHMRNLHGRFCSTMFGEKRPYSCPKCHKASNHDPANDSHICQPFFVESLKMKDSYKGVFINLCTDKTLSIFRIGIF